jgi:hypothetical protein
VVTFGKAEVRNACESRYGADVPAVPEATSVSYLKRLALRQTRAAGSGQRRFGLFSSRGKTARTKPSDRLDLLRSSSELDRWCIYSGSFFAALGLWIRRKKVPTLHPAGVCQQDHHPRPLLAPVSQRNIAARNAPFLGCTSKHDRLRPAFIPDSPHEE